MTIPSGTSFGPYEILDKIGAGGMGEVYRATDSRLQRQVAIKFISDSYLAGEVSSGTPVSHQPLGTPHSASHLSEERFLREARASATLNHPNICQIYDTGQQDGRPYLVMELLEGATLKDVLREGRLSVTEVVTFATQAASALAAAHAKGIVHRDIKPANLFVCGTGTTRRQIKILDFGLAKKQGPEPSPDSRTYGAPGSDAGSEATAIGATGTMAPTALDLTSPGSTVGTVAYMSPEQARGAPLDARTDLFSLGSVIYEMATGRSPFAGVGGSNSTADIFAALLMKDPPPVSSVNPAMPPELDPILSRLLAKEKDQRYQSADDLLSDLEGITLSGSARASSGSSGVISAAATQRSAGKVSRRNMVIVVACVLAIVAGLIPLIMHHRTAPAADQAATVATPSAAVMKDSIIVADFVNKTGDPVFDTTLNQALAVQLGQSPVLTLVSQRHLRQSLQFLGKKQDETVTPAIAREIGEREGVKAILTGTIASIGKQYLITLTAQNTATGDDIATTQANAADKDHVLDALNKASAEMRAQLGEGLSSIKKLNAPFGQATTPSLEAFRAYALGDEAHQRGDDIPEAEGHYKRALELDPNLAMAWARLGVVYINSGQADRANVFFAKAHTLTANVSEREKLYIDGHYYTEVTGDLNKGIETLQEATQLYPLVLDNFINLGVAYRLAGETDKGIECINKALALQPEDAVSLENVIGEYLFRDDYSHMRDYIARADKAGLKGTTLLSTEMAGYAQSGDEANAQRLEAELSGRPDKFAMTTFLGTLAMDQGKVKEAAASYQRAAEQAIEVKANDAAAIDIITAAAAGWIVDQCHDVAGAAKKALALDKDKSTLAAVADDMASCGDKGALPLLAELQKKNPGDTRVQELFVPLGRAVLALKDGRAQEAIALMDRSKAYDWVSPSAYLRGVAYLQLHDAQNAISALKISARYRGAIAFTNIPRAMGALQLGRAYAMAGDKVNAKKSYDVFFKEWKDADADLPVMGEAKKEYASL